SVEHLEQSAAEYLAWSRIVEDSDALNLDRAQERQAKERRHGAEAAIGGRLGEAHRWRLVPRQSTGARARRDVAEHGVEGSAALALRASDRLEREGTLLRSYPPVLLRTLLDGVLASEWSDGHVSVERLWDVFTQYPYLPKLRDRRVLEGTVAEGPGSVTWATEGFVVADLYDAEKRRYAGLKAGEMVSAVSQATLV